MKPYGKHLELLNNGIGVILTFLYDVARMMEVSVSNCIFDRDIKPLNLINQNCCSYFIDWGVAMEGSEVQNFILSFYCLLPTIN